MEISNSNEQGHGGKNNCYVFNQITRKRLLILSKATMESFGKYNLMSKATRF